jgi:hypothetical protein
MGSEDFAFMPVPVGVAYLNDKETNIRFRGGQCFGDIRVNVKFISKPGTHIEKVKAKFTVTAKKQVGFMCQDNLIIGNTFS